jgi:uncharacterized protein YcbK (DUF882 family)
MSDLSQLQGTKMTPELWKAAKFFTPAEQWGDPEKMSAELIYRLDKYRARLNRKFVVHCGFKKDGHSEKSKHYLGEATDGHVENIDLLDMFLSAEREGFNGIGLYEWGIHLDVRPAPAARWCFIDEKQLPLNAVYMDILRMRYKHKKPR